MDEGQIACYKEGMSLDIGNEDEAENEHSYHVSVPTKVTWSFIHQTRVNCHLTRENDCPGIMIATTIRRM
jgi:hypothetical protein